MSAYFVVLPLRDEGAISLGLSKLPGLFVGSLFLTLIAAPLSTFIFSLPNLSKSKALVIIHRFFSLSLVLCFLLWMASPTESNSKLRRLPALQMMELMLLLDGTTMAGFTFLSGLDFSFGLRCLILSLFLQRGLE